MQEVQEVVGLEEIVVVVHIEQLPLDEMHLASWEE